MVEILKMRLEKYKSYFKDYRGILETLEDLKDSNKDSFLYVLEYISKLLYYLEKCGSELEIQDGVTEDFDYSEYSDETEEETSFEIDDGEEDFDYSEYNDDGEEDFDYSEYSDDGEEDFDYSEYSDETEEETSFEIDDGEEDFDYSEYNDETEEDFDYSEYSDETEEETSFERDDGEEDFDYSEYNDETEEDFDFSEYEDTDEDDEVDTELSKGTIIENKRISDTPYKKGERSGYNDKVDFSSDTGDYAFSAYDGETDELDYNLSNGSMGYGDKQSSNIGLKNEGKGYIDTSEFENIEFPDFDLKDYQQSKIYSDDLADKMADTLKKLSDGAKKFFTDKNKPKK